MIFISSYHIFLVLKILINYQNHFIKLNRNFHSKFTRNFNHNMIKNCNILVQFSSDICQAIYFIHEHNFSLNGNFSLKSIIYEVSFKIKN